jgi:hypothetical protein
MLRLERGALELARESFEAEIASLGGRLLSDEYARDANDGLGFVSLGQQDLGGAGGAFERALDRYPSHVRSLLGMAEVCRRSGAAERSTRLVEQAAAAARDLASAGRLQDAKLAEAMIQVVSGRPTAAIEALTVLFDRTSGSSTGWMTGLEPLFRPLSGQPSFHSLRQKLSDGAR